MQNRDVKILIRFDDICPSMNWEQWNIAEEILCKHGVKPLIGVIPDCQDSDLQLDEPRLDFWEWVRKKQSEGYAIAMHGFRHVFCSPHHGIINKRMASEYAGLPLDVQCEYIRKGKEILESHGIFTDVFFAPAHSYDENTLKALYQNGFKYISDGKSAKAYVLHGIKCIPCLSSGAGRIPRNGYHTSIFHAHEWVREDKVYEFNRLKEIMDNYAECIVDWNQYKSQPIGTTRWMRMNERIVVFWQCCIRPFLVKCYLTLKRLK